MKHHILNNVVKWIATPQQQLICDTTLYAKWNLVEQSSSDDTTPPVTPSDPTTPNKAGQSGLTQTGDAMFAFIAGISAVAVATLVCALYVARRKAQHQPNKR